MPDTPAKGQVYSNANVGLATRFGREAPNLFQMIDQEEAKIAQQKALKDKANQEKGKSFAKSMEYSPKATFTPYAEEQSLDVKNYYDNAANLMRNMSSMSEDESLNVQMELKRQKSAIDLKWGKADKIKESTDKFIADLKSNPHYNESYGEKMIGELLHNDDGTLKPITEIDEDYINESYKHPELYNGAAIVNDFQKNFEADIFSYVDETAYGHNEKQAKAKFYELDENGEIIYDQNGDAIMNLSPELLNLAKKDGDMALQIQFEKERIAEEEDRDDVTDMDAFTRLIQPHAYIEEREKYKESALKRQRDKQAYGRGEKDKLIIERKKLIDAIQKGEPKALSSLKQGKYDGKIITDVEFDPSGEESVLRLRLTTKQGDDSEKIIPLGADDGGNFQLLNTVINTVTGEEKFSIEDLTEAPEVKPIEQVEDIEYETLNKDIKDIQTTPTGDSKSKGTDILESIDGITEVEYEDSELTFKQNGYEVVIDLSKDESYEQLKEILLEQARKKYTVKGGKDRGILD